MLKKQHAPESEHVLRARRKLQRMMEDEAQFFNPERLAQVTKVMHEWIYRNASERTTLKSKSIHLFDGNQNAAAIDNSYIHFLRKQLEKDASDKDTKAKQDREVSFTSLKGRVSVPKH